MARSRLDRCEVEKLELVRVLEMKQGEMTSLNEQLESLIKRQAVSRQELLSKESALEESRRQLSAAQLQATTASQQSEASRKQAEWASAELERAITELRDYRKLKVSTI
jgi:multidrug resistance efflux pump